MSRLEEVKIKHTDSKRFRTKFLAELEKLKKSPLYEKALEEVIALEKKKNQVTSFELDFSVQFSTLFGEKMAVVGGIEELGNWDPSRAVEMSWTEGNIWRCTVVGEGNLTEAPFKYVCIRGTLVRWEAGDNRILDPKKGEKVGNRLKICNEDIWQR